MVYEDNDVDPQNIKPLTNEELTKLLLVSNRLISKLTSEINSLQNQINELSRIILETRLAEKLNTSIKHLDSDHEFLGEKTQEVITTYPAKIEPIDLLLLGKSISGGGDMVVMDANTTSKT